MKNLLSVLLISCMTLPLFAQVGINTTTPDVSAALDVQAANKGILIPRVSLDNVATTQIDGVNTAATGLLIYNTNAATTGGSGEGFYVFNGTTWDRVTTSADGIGGGDADFYEEGTTTPPDAITDDMYTQGNVAIGKTTADYPIDIFASGGRSVNILMPGSDNSQKEAIRNDILNSGNGDHYGMHTTFASNGSGAKRGVFNLFQNTPGLVDGIFNQIFTNGTAFKVGIRNQIVGGGNSFRFGVSNTMINNGAIAQYGVDNNMGGNGTGFSYGTRNLLTGNANRKFGVYNSIEPSSAGFHYGIYSEVTKTGGFAGLFNGNVAIGTSSFLAGTPDWYIMPASRGTNGQVMQTDGSGNVSWVDASTIGGNDADFFEEGTTSAPNSINDNIYTLGNVAIGKNTANYPLDIVATGIRGTSVLMNGTDNGIKVATRNDISNTGTGNHFGVYNSLSGSGIGVKKGIENYFSGTINGTLIGVENSMILSNGSNSDKTGTRNQVSSNGNGIHTGTQNIISSSGTGNQYGLDTSLSGVGTGDFYGLRTTITGGAANKYGSFINIDETSAGTHYGLYSQALKANSYAGYFLGRLSVGTTAANAYILPASRGTNNQIMQTDGSGNVNWVDVSTISNSWNVTGNAGTNAASNFLGTTDNTSLSFRTNNIERLQINTSGSLISPSSNIKWGLSSGNNLSTGVSNTLLGITSGLNITSGSQNIMIGSGAGRSVTTGNSVIAIGLSALSQYQGSFGTIALGAYALERTTSGVGSIAMGANALRFNTTGNNNLALGSNALSNGTTPTANIAIGNSALINNSGFNNIAIGLGSLANNSSGNNNTVVGKEAGLRNTGTGNTIMGYFASIFTTTGNDNTIIGNQAGRNGNMGNNNVLLGAYSGRQLTGASNVFIGYNSGLTQTNVSNRLIIDNSSTTNPLIYGEFDSNILRANGTLQVGNPTGTGYAFPVTDGTVNQIMQTDGSGNVSWVDNTSTSFWSRSGSILDVANAGDVINFASDQTNFTFPATNGSPSSIINLFETGTNNSDRMIISQSPTFSNWGLMYRDSNDSFRFLSGGNDRVVVNLGGTGNSLVVNGTAQATAFQSATTTYPDYVFENYFEGTSTLNPEYEFKALEEVEAFIKEHGHLPGVTSYTEVLANNMQINLTQTSVKNLEKIEELYLYTIQLKKENDTLKEHQAQLEKRLMQLEKLLLKE